MDFSVNPWTRGATLNLYENSAGDGQFGFKDGNADTTVSYTSDGKCGQNNNGHWQGPALCVSDPSKSGDNTLAINIFERQIDKIVQWLSINILLS